jgi:hypothetical protein
VDPAADAARDLDYVRSILDRTQRRLDPHAFHFVGWGAIVLVWYPLENALALGGYPGSGRLALGVTALVLGCVVGGVGEFRLARRAAAGDEPPEDTVLSRQVLQIVWGCLGPAILLSAVGPALGMIPGSSVPLVWGLAYAVMAWMVGVVYSREFLWAGAWIFAGFLAALLLPGYEGLVLGPAMGLGLLVPGMIAERRVRRRGSTGGAQA